MRKPKASRNMTAQTLTSLAMFLLIIGEEVVQGVFGSLAVLLLLVREKEDIVETDTQKMASSAIRNKH